MKGQTLAYRVKFNRRRKTRSVIKIHPDGDVWVDCPPSVNLLQVQKWVREQAEWLLRRRSEIARGEGFIAPLAYAEQAPQLYLGKSYALKLLTGRPSAATQGVFGNSLYLHIRSTEVQAVKARLWCWYREQARKIFQQRLVELSAEIPWVKAVPALKLRKMRRRWGSCTSHGLVTLNTHLIKAPPACIDYVILHELCHLREHNHSPRFYRLMDQVLPEWRAVKQRLDVASDKISNE